MKTKLKFAEGMSSPFYSDVKTRIEEYFSNKPKGRRANGNMIVKSIFIIVSYLVLYGLLITSNFTPISGITFCILLGLLHPLFFINIGHDAIHNTYSKKKWVNRLLSYSLNLIGLNAYIN